MWRKHHHRFMNSPIILWRLIPSNFYSLEKILSPAPSTVIWVKASRSFSIVCGSILIQHHELFLFGWLVFLVILALSLVFGSNVAIAAEPQVPPPSTQTNPKYAQPRKRQEKVEEEEESPNREADAGVLNTSVSDVTFAPPPAPAPAAPHICEVKPELEKARAEENLEEKEKEKKLEAAQTARKKVFWLKDDDIPPIMWDEELLHFIFWSIAVKHGWVWHMIHVNSGTGKDLNILHNFFCFYLLFPLTHFTLLLF